MAVSSAEPSPISEATHSGLATINGIPASDKEAGLADNDDDTEEDSPYFEVRAAISNRDDPSLPSLTLRVWIIGILSCSLLAFANQILWLRTKPISISTLIVQILSYPLGRGLAYLLPKWRFRTFGYEWSPNPGPFSIKEHVLITVMSSTAASACYGVDVIIVKNLFYRPDNAMPDFWPSLLMMVTSQMIGYGLAGICRQLLVYPASMVWPANLASAIVYRTFHDVSRWPGLSRTAMFWLVFFCAFAWNWIPGYLVGVLGNLAILCLFNRRSVTMLQLSDGLSGIGLLNLPFDWSTIGSGLLGSPIVTPFWAACNIFAGFVIFFWILLPALYYTNTWDSQRFPIFTSDVFDAQGNKYDILRVMTKNYRLNQTAYEDYSQPRMPASVAVMYGASFAILTSLISYTLLYHGADIKARLTDARNQPADIHMKLMGAYKEVPFWWYIAVYVSFLALAMFTCEYWADEFGLSWFMLLFAMTLPLLFIIPIGMIQAVTNQQPGLNIITELIFGYIYPGNAIGNATFKVYGYISLVQGLLLVGDLKLGHYMKIPPRHMFIVQAFGTILAATVQFLALRFMIAHVDGLCRPEQQLSISSADGNGSNLANKGSTWSCTTINIFFSASLLWGAIGPRESFNNQSYRLLLHAFWLGLLLPIPIYFLQRWFTKLASTSVSQDGRTLKGARLIALVATGLNNIHIPVLLSSMNNATAIPTNAFFMWLLVGGFFNFYLKRRKPVLWERYVYSISGGLDAGTAICTLVIFALMQSGVNVPNWNGNKAICLSEQTSSVRPQTVSNHSTSS
ncbi:oligopeptide transporter 6-like protein [Ramicandelaber brevisporus]|nr:oligopeptide transporter 6-like protein [Ramicandelaber brevisporus]